MIDRLDAFRAAIRSGDADRLGSLLIENVLLRSPVRFKPYVGRAVAQQILIATESVLNGRRGLARFDDGPLTAVIYEAEVGAQKVQGVELVRFDGDDIVTEVTVFLRPASGLEATRQAMVLALGMTPPT